MAFVVTELTNTSPPKPDPPPSCWKVWTASGPLGGGEEQELDTTITTAARAAVADLRNLTFILVVTESNGEGYLLGERDVPSPVHDGGQGLFGQAQPRDKPAAEHGKSVGPWPT